MIMASLKLYGLIADEPERSSSCGHKQHNGLYGCIYCMNPGLTIGMFYMLFKKLSLSKKRVPYK